MEAFEEIIGYEDVKHEPVSYTHLRRAEGRAAAARNVERPGCRQAGARGYSIPFVDGSASPIDVYKRQGPVCTPESPHDTPRQTLQAE